MTINRRELLASLTLGTVGAVSHAARLRAAPHLEQPLRDATRIARENARQGTREWMLQNTQIDPQSRYRCPVVEGFASHASAAAGDTVQLMVSTHQDDHVALQIYRMGYYGGAGARQVHSVAPLPCHPQPLPAPSQRRLLRCDWKPLYAWQVPDDALSGVYLAKLTSQRTAVESYVVFIVRDQREADVVFQCSDFTWQAYNRWPSQFSLYDNGEQEWYWGGESQVSFDRPYGKYCQILDAPLSIGSGEFLLWEFPFAYWLESQGYDVTYISNLDTHRNTSTLTRGRAVLSVGHDEYWTLEMFRHMQEAVAHGTSIGFFSGNAVCGRIAWDDRSRSLRRVGVFGPPGGTREFQAMSHLEHTRPYANELIGAHSTGPVTGGADWICSQPDHWVFAGTGMQQGDAIPGLVGWEWHGDPAPIADLEVIATGPTQSAPGEPNGGQYTATVYPGPRGNLVFNAATIWWADGLSEPPGYVRPAVYTTPQGPDRRVQQITTNVLARMLDGDAR
jgi:hypothetical protein